MSESDQKGNLRDALYKIIASQMGMPFPKHKEGEIKVGDKVRFTSFIDINYLVDKESENKESIAKSPVPMELISYFNSGEAIFGGMLDEELVFTCGHCNKPHKHDCIIYYPILKKTYYTTFSDLELA